MRGIETPERKDRHGRHILIVDDDPAIATILKTALQRSGRDYRVTIVHSGEEALEVLERSPVDLLVTDLRMPGISGLDLIRWVRASSPHTRTILITAYGNDEVEAEARRLEVCRYIAKPFGLSDLTRAVEDILGKLAVARPGLVILADDCFETIAQELERLREEIGARCIFLADMQGQRLVEVGDVRELNVTTLLALLAGGVAASAELAHQFGDDHPFNLNFHEGSRYDIYSTTVKEGFFLAIVCDRLAQPSKIGLVWLYTRRAIERLRSLLSETETEPSSPALGAEFRTSLALELDNLLSDGPADGLAGSSSFEEGRSAHVTPTHTEPPPAAAKEGPGKPESELIDLQTAIERGIISSDFLIV